jgi:uncharacterized coiled-coil protein SlyX
MESRKCFNLNDKVKIEISKNDFDELGSIVELNIKTTTQILLSFYDNKKNQINQNQLIFITNNEYFTFDNVYILKASDNSIPIKLLNKEIQFIKVFALNSKGKKSPYLININDLTLLNNSEEFKAETQGTQVQLNQNDNISLILEELSRVNKDLINEKEQLEKNKAIIKNKEDQIGNMILGFKKDILLYYDKCYNEITNKLNSRVADLNKKLQIIENNVLNKYKIIKEKITTKVETKKNEICEKPKDKTANLEIKIKFLEDTINTLKNKIIEKDELIKTLSENDEKLTKAMKKLKEENINLNSKLKQADEKIKACESVNITTTENSLSKVKEKSKIKKTKFDIPSKKELIQILDSFIINILIQKNYEKINMLEKDLQTNSNLLLNICTNPISLFNEFQNAYLITTKKLADYLISITNKTILQTEINNTINNSSELKKEIYSFTYSDLDRSKFAILNIFIAEKIRFNEMVLNRIDYFYNYLNKNEKKVIEKSGKFIYKLTKLSCLILNFIFCYEDDNLLTPIRQIIMMISMLSKEGNSAYLVNFLLTINFFDLLFNFINYNDNFKRDLMKCYIDLILLLYSLNYNIFELNKNTQNHFNEIILNKYIDWTNISEESNLIIFLTILSKYQDIPFKDKLNGIAKDNIKDKLIKENLDCILTN